MGAWWGDGPAPARPRKAELQRRVDAALTLLADVSRTAPPLGRVDAAWLLRMVNELEAVLSGRGRLFGPLKSLRRSSDTSLDDGRGPTMT